MMLNRFNRERNAYPYINKLHHATSDPSFEIVLLLSQLVMQAQQAGICIHKVMLNQHQNFIHIHGMQGITHQVLNIIAAASN